MKKLTISIGISAYNEQANIANVITSFLYQKETNFVLKATKTYDYYFLF